MQNLSKNPGSLGLREGKGTITHFLMAMVLLVVELLQISQADAQSRDTQKGLPSPVGSAPFSRCPHQQFSNPGCLDGAPR